MKTLLRKILTTTVALWAAGAWAAESAKLPKLVDLGADKCIPCKAMAPILKDLKAEYAGRMDVEFIDVWKNPEPGKAYKIKMIPTQIFFDASGKELFRHVGFYGREDILGKWKELGVDLKAKASAGIVRETPSPIPCAQSLHCRTRENEIDRYCNFCSPAKGKACMLKSESGSWVFSHVDRY